jgi:hypothetical protein
VYHARQLEGSTPGT